MKATNVSEVLGLLVGQDGLSDDDLGRDLIEVIVTTNEVNPAIIDRAVKVICGLNSATDAAQAFRALLIAWPGTENLLCIDRRVCCPPGHMTTDYAAGYILALMEAAVWLKQRGQLVGAGYAADFARHLAEFLTLIAIDSRRFQCGKEVLGRVANVAGPFLDATDPEVFYLTVGSRRDLDDAKPPYEALGMQVLAEINKAAFRKLGVAKQVKALNGGEVFC